MPSPLSACEACGRRWRGEGRATASSSESRTRAQGGWWEHPLPPPGLNSPPKHHAGLMQPAQQHRGILGLTTPFSQPNLAFPTRASTAPEVLPENEPGALQPPPAALWGLQ